MLDYGSTPFVLAHRGMDLAAELQKIYDSEINVSISWLWDSGIEVRLGDEVNGFLAEETFADAAGILPWLQQALGDHPKPANEGRLKTGQRAS